MHRVTRPEQMTTDEPDELQPEYNFDYSHAKPNRFYDFRTMRGVARGKYAGRASGIAEISFDLLMQDDMAFIEGAFRFPDGVWQVVIVTKVAVKEAEVTLQVWESGATGVVVGFPHDRTLNRQAVEEVLSAAFGVQSWQVVRGPDSMTLR